MYYWTQWTVRSTVTTSPKLHSHQKAGEHANCYDCGQCMRFRHDRYPFNIYIYIYRRRMYIERDSRRYKITFIVVYYCVLLSNGTMNNKRLIQTVQTHKHTIHTWHMCERQKRPCYGDHTLNTLNTLAYKTNKAIHTQTENIVSESFLFFFCFTFIHKNCEMLRSRSHVVCDCAVAHRICIAFYLKFSVSIASTVTMNGNFGLIDSVGLCIGIGNRRLRWTVDSLNCEMLCNGPHSPACITTNAYL